MAAYVIADVDVTDPASYAEYRTLVPKSLEPYGGRFLVRGGAHEVLEGEWKPKRLVVLEFPTRAAAERWYASEEYRHAKAIRLRAARTNVVLVEGV